MDKRLGECIELRRRGSNTINHMAISSPHPLDVALGGRIRLRRRELGISQDKLAQQIGITFQQIQKYEHGTNRVSFSRLMEIAEVLQCGVAQMVDELDRTNAPPAGRVASLNEPGAVELMEAYASIKSSAHRRAILNLATQLAGIAKT
ncbi:MAG: helix-turn-helix transcriptional regulator [Rhizomicrobium sp.]